MCSKGLITALILYLCFNNAHQHKVEILRDLDIDGIRPPTDETYWDTTDNKHWDTTDDKHLDTSDDKHWDFFIFTQQWPSSSCKVWTHKKPNHHCVFPNKTNTWTVHGIWPTRGGNKGPFNCNTTWLFDPEQVKPIESELEQAWTNIEKETPLYDFWAHEWNKHGTCAAMIEAFNSEFKYFSKGINFLYKYHMNDILNSANIFPSDTNELKAQDISNAVSSKLGKRPFIACEFEDGIQYLIELRICFDKQLNLMECVAEEVNDLLTNCNVNRGIIYPPQIPEPKRQLVQLYKFTNWLQWFTL